MNHRLLRDPTSDIPIRAAEPPGVVTDLVRHVLRLAYMLGLGGEPAARDLRFALRRLTKAESLVAYHELQAALDRLSDPVFEVIDDWKADAADSVIALYDAAEAAVVDASGRHARTEPRGEPR